MLSRPSHRGLLKNVHKLQVAITNLSHSSFGRDLPGQPATDWIPENSLSRGEADESLHLSCSCQPFEHPLLVPSIGQDDAGDFGTPAAASSSHNSLAVIAAIESFYSPYVRLDLCIL